MVFATLTFVSEFTLRQKNHSFDLHDHYDHLLQMIMSLFFFSKMNPLTAIFYQTYFYL